MKVFDGTGYRDATPDEIAAWKEASSQPAPPPSPQEQAMILARTLAASHTELSDTVALSIPDILPRWDELLAVGNQIESGVCLVYENQIYRVVQPVTPQSHQAPGTEGMLAIYRPIDNQHSGSLADPIPFAYGMDCNKDLYYIYKGEIYLCKSDMIACNWLPDSGIWQWEKVTQS